METLLHYFKHLFTPHQTNNHRPRSLHPKALFYYIIFFLILQVTFRTISIIRPDILGFATNITVDDLLNLTNQKRMETGLAPLKLDPSLSQAAAGKAQDMFVKDYWAHNSPEGITPWNFILGAGYRYIFAGENLAKEFSDSAGVVSAWMNSPTHRENILKSEYQDIGFAVVDGILNGKETTLVVQMFGAKQTSMVAQRSIPVVQAQEERGEILVTPVPTETPFPTPVLIAQAEKIETPPLGVVKKPRIDEFSLSRNISLVLMGGLLTVLTLDGFLIIRRRTVRIAGHNAAHFIFLAGLMGVVLLSTTGAIL